ncbi:MAG: metal-sensing transcriptional repressor [Candidatus Fimivivens sp.]|nr:metal-sensing transcriptional repressor [Candidatus Fimivivens sp.]
MRADKEKVSRLLKTARGQLDGLLRMVEDDRYCIDISTQLMATEAILRRANREVVAAHMQGCLIEAAQQGNAEQKVDELMKLIDKMAK